MFGCVCVCVCVLANQRSTRYENESIVCFLRGFRVIYLILDCCRGYADRQGHETRDTSLPTGHGRGGLHQATVRGSIDGYDRGQL